MVETVNLTYLVELVVLSIGFVTWIGTVAFGMHVMEQRLGGGEDKKESKRAAAELNSP